MTHIAPSLLVLCGLTAACRTLHPAFEPPAPSQALPPAREGPLAALAATCGQRAEPGESSLLLLERGEDALDWRLALVDSARRSLDLQYYIWKGDFSGRLLLSRVVAAAERGVRVRILVDDYSIRGKDQILAALDDHPRVEVRDFNPWRHRAQGFLVEYLWRFGRLNHRMHNKILVADNLAVVTGGRNIGDEYYGLSPRRGFHDLDVLALGPVVEEVSAMFDHYWNSDWVVPGSALWHDAGVEELPALTAEALRALERSPQRERFGLEPRDWSAFLAQAAGALVTGQTTLLYDRLEDQLPAQDMLDGLRETFALAQEEVLISNAYLIPGRPFLEGLAAAEARGIRVRLLTNSLASTNHAMVYAGYAPTRRPMLAAGAELAELRARPALAAQVIDTAPTSAEQVVLHTKAMVIDRRHVLVGSFNFDPRSANINTEMGLVVESAELGEDLARRFERDMAPENAWSLELTRTGKLRWSSVEGVRWGRPARGCAQVLASGLYGLLPIRSQL